MAMSETSLNIIIRATDEASGILEAFEEQVQAATDTVSEMMATLLASTQLLQAQMGNFQAQTANVSENVTGLNNDMTDSTTQTTDALDEAQMSLATTGAEMGTFGEVVAETATPLGALTADLALAEAGSISLGEGADTAQEAIEGINEQTTAAAASVEVMGTSMDTAAAQVDEAATTITTGVDEAVTSIGTLPTAAATAGTEMAAGITAGVTEADASLDTLTTTADAAVENLQGVGAEADAAGDEIASGLTAGVGEADTALDSMGATADTVGAEVDVSLDSIAASATATRDTLTGLGGSFSSVLMGAMAIGGGVMGLDALTGHAAATAEAMESLSDKTGMTADESAQMLAIFNATSTSAQTVTGTIERLDKAVGSAGTTGNATTKALQKYGVSLTDANGNMLPFSAQLEALSNGYKNAGDNTEAFTADVLSMRGSNLDPLLANFQQLQTLTSSIKSPFGDDQGLKNYLQEVYNLHNNMTQVSNDIAKIGVDITPAMEKVSKGLEDVLGDLTGGKGVIQAFEDWSKDIGAVGTAITVLAGTAAIIEGITVATKLATDAQAAWNAIMLAGQWAAFGVEMTVMGIAEGVVTTATWLWTAAQAALDAVLSPMGLVILGVAAAVAILAVGVYEVIEHWSTIRAVFKTLWTDIKTDATAIWTDIKTWFETNWNAIKADANTIWTDIKNFFPDLWTDIKTSVTTAWDDIKTFFDTLWADIVADANTIWTPIKTFFEDAWNDINSVATAAWNDFKTAIGDVWNWIVQEVTSAVNAVEALINKIVGDIDRAISAVKSLLGMSGSSSTGAQGSVNIAMANHAEGGIATSATAGVFGEAGPEALIPLDSPQGQGILGGAFFGGNSGGGGNQTVINIQCSGNITQNEEALAQVIMQKIAERMSLIGGLYDSGWATGRS